MQIIKFKSMTDKQKEHLYSFTKQFNQSLPSSCDEMCKYWGGAAFDQGESFFGFFQDNIIIGTIGVVTREVQLRNEIFIAGFNVQSEYIHKCGEILSYAIKICESYKDVSLKLGIREHMLVIVPYLQQQGFEEVYRLNVLKLNKDFGIEYKSKLCYQPLSPSNIKHFQSINNAAFLNSPNGSSFTDEELEDILEEYKDMPDYSAVAYADTEFVGMFTLAEKDSTGWIDSIGVKPELQGRGIGKEVLFKAVEVLQKHGLTDIKLTVMSANENAVRLYMKYGFEFEGVLSIWYEKKI